MESHLVSSAIIFCLLIAVHFRPSSQSFSTSESNSIEPTDGTSNILDESDSIKGGEEEGEESIQPDKDLSEWSAWTTWSECSRSCNGGVTYQLRKCNTKSGCQGEAAKYRICNMQPCPEAEDFRASQCAEYNQIAYRGHLYEWLPYQDPEDPCSLTCHARSYSFVAKLSSTVLDGTRCREGSLDMCVNGKCLEVGCDLQLGSNKQVDECGVCGGDGSTCRRPVYVWGKTPFSPCSVSCGGGYQMSRPSCLNKATDKEVDERLCDVTLKPRPHIKECNVNQCPPVWVTDSWSPCSASCGGGRQSRQVHCAQVGSDGSRLRVDMRQCLRQKPLTERPCNLTPCPQWITGPWSGCSVTCAKGHKSRSVACQDAKGHHSEECDIEVMPATKLECDSGLICAASEDPGTYLFSDIFKNSQEDAPPMAAYQSLSWKQKFAPVSSEPTYVAGEWSSCSVTCGKGLRKRKVDCNIFLDFSRTVATLPNKECPGPRPPDIETCFTRPCSLDHSKPSDTPKSSKTQVGIEVTYSWRVNGFTPCSASCLGGHRESIVQCVRDHDQALVTSSHCDISQKIKSITQTCNDHPCPPKWNVSDYTPCSKQCGGGIQTRVVHCLHELTRGTANTLVVSNDQCPQPPPRDKQLCNIFDCPTVWKTEPWSKCSKSCGGGEKTRKIRCMREQAFGQVVELAPSSCKRRPKTQKPCNQKPCPVSEGGQMSRPVYPSHQVFVQDKVEKKISLKVGGTATVFAGTSLKIRCPKKRTNKTDIVWFRNDEKISSTRRLKISTKGALRIRKISFKDEGKYSCVSGHFKSDLFINVKPSPATSKPNKVNQKSPENNHKTKQKAIEKSTEEVYSHERPPHFPDAKGDPHQQNAGNNENRFSKSHEDKDGHSVITAFDPIKNNEISRENSVIHKHPDGKNKYDINTVDRVPLYMRNGHQTEAPDISSSTTESNIVYHPNSESHELVPNRYKPNEDGINPDRNDIPQVADTWEQKYDGSKRKQIHHRPYDTWERNHGSALFSDQESGELNVGTPHGGKGFNEPASSGAASNHAGSHIQQLLVNLHHTLGGSSKPRATMYNVQDVQDTSDEDDEPVYMNPSKLAANSFVLGKGRAENLEFEWVIGEWATCSHSCGGTGFQVRASQCLVRLNNVTKTVDSSLCDDAGLQTPDTIRNCGTEDCPHWDADQWSQCLESHCFTWHSSYQKRLIHCLSQNGTTLPLWNCDPKTRPRRKRECYNERCRSVWRVGEWSQCTASCSRQGFQSRILQCVWFGSSKPAGNACRDQARPPVLRPCSGPQCQSSEGKRVHRSFQLLQLGQGLTSVSPESLSSPVL